MVYLLLGLILGALGALSHVGWIAGPINGLTTALVTLGAHLTLHAAGWFGHRNVRLGKTIAIVLAVAVPGLVCLGLVAAARAGLALRRGVSGLLLVAAVAGFFVLPVGEAVALAVAAVVVAVALFLASGVLLVLPLAALAGAVGVSSGSQLLHHSTSVLGSAPHELVPLTGVNDPQLWTLALVVVAWSGFVGAVVLALRGTSTPDTE